jgi:pimeloyl-ACP methyl ester carboxylesterase
MEEDGSVQYLGVERSLAQLQDVVGREQFDLLVGYSQGAAMVAMLAAMHETGRLHPSGRWRGAILLNSGGIPRDPTLRGWIQPPIQLPSLHVFGGRRDFTHREQREMHEIWDPRTRSSVEHDEGHAPPTLARSQDVLTSMRDWARRLSGEAIEA